ncbi:MAG: flagellar hook-length control protein FliK [Methylococcales bacterium]|jgi:hypothetical protein|nr:flagellar hook-length control protein FliK [Methylococcales bacterium]
MMDIPPPLKSQLSQPRTVTVKVESALNAQINKWQVGQIINARVASQVNSNTVALSINNQVYNASSPTQLLNGQQLRLEVLKKGQTSILKILDSMTSKQGAIDGAMRKALPNQSGLTQLTSNLQQLSKMSAGQIPQHLIDNATNALKQFPTLADAVNANGVKQSLGNSGLFLEARLLQSLSGKFKGTLSADIKGLFTQFLSQLKEQVQTSNQPIKIPEDLQKLVDKLNGQLPLSIKQSDQALMKQALKDIAVFLDQKLTSVITTPPGSTQQTTAKYDLFAILNGLPTKQYQQFEQSQGKFANELGQQGKQLLNLLPGSMKNTLPEGLKTTLKDAAVILENRLNQLYNNQIPPQMASELKSALLKTLDRMKQSQNRPVTTAKPSEAKPLTKNTSLQPQEKVEGNLKETEGFAKMVNQLLQQTEGALSRIEIAQLESLHDDDYEKTVWSHELPINTDNGIDLFQIKFEQYKNQQAPDDDSNWSVSMAFSLDSLGPMQVKLFMADEQLSTILWAEESKTLDAINQQIPKLEDRLQKAGLFVKQIVCHPGKPPEPQPSKQSQPHHSILDEQT